MIRKCMRTWFMDAIYITENIFTLFLFLYFFFCFIKWQHILLVPGQKYLLEKLATNTQIHRLILQSLAKSSLQKVLFCSLLYVRIRMDSQELLGLLAHRNLVWIFLCEVSQSSPRPLGGASFRNPSQWSPTSVWLKKNNNQKHFHVFVIFPDLFLGLFCTCTPLFFFLNICCIFSKTHEACQRLFMSMP